MRLLFDQNISARIIPLLREAFPGSTQVTLEGLSNARDLEIWHWAKKNDYSIVTFDSDFVDILTLKGFPPKIILLRLGNRRTRELAEVIQNRQSVIQEFLNDNNIGCLEIFVPGFF